MLDQGSWGTLDLAPGAEKVVTAAFKTTHAQAGRGVFPARLVHAGEERAVGQGGLRSGRGAIEAASPGARHRGGP